MKHFLRIAIALPFFSLAQITSNKTTFIIPKKATVNVADIKEDFFTTIQCTEKPVPGGFPQKQPINTVNQNQGGTLKTAATMATLSPIYLGKNFIGNPYNNSTPNDNDLAISNNCKIISVSNTIIYFHDCVKDSAQGLVSLSAFAAPLGSFSSAFDPKVAYDPVADRFALTFLNGFTPTTSSIVVAFSQTNDPKGLWNFYALPGNPYNNNLWTDYPMISFSQKEVFITVNLLTPGGTWQTSFSESIIWQINKSNGYNGLPLTTQVHNNIKYAGNNLRNICPVKGGSTLYGPRSYFLSNRNFGMSSDTVFLVDLSDTINAPGQTLTVKMLKTPRKYSMAPDAKQAGGQTFATNDARVLGAFYENNKIQYVHNTQDSTTLLCAVYHGVIGSVSSATPSIVGYVINHPIEDFGYPNISYAGSSASDNTSIINFDHTATTVNAGLSAIKSDGTGNYSPRLNIKNGTTYVDVLSGTQERWGDYTGSQRKYNEIDKTWVNGYYGYFNGGRKHATWIAEIGLNFILTDVKQTKAETSMNVYPNPVSDFVHINFDVTESDVLSFVLYDITGKEVKTMLREFIKPGKQMFSFSMEPLAKGVYFLKISSSKQEFVSQKIVKD